MQKRLWYAFYLLVFLCSLHSVWLHKALSHYISNLELEDHVVKTSRTHQKAKKRAKTLLLDISQHQEPHNNQGSPNCKLGLIADRYESRGESAEVPEGTRFSEFLLIYKNSTSNESCYNFIRLLFSC